MTDLARRDDGERSLFRPAGGSVRSRLAARLLRRLLGSLRHGAISIELPDGSRCEFQGATAGAVAKIKFRSFGPFWQMMRRGSLGLAESYLRGDWETPDLAAVFHLYVANHAAVVRQRKLRVPRGWRDRHYHKARLNTRKGSRRNIAAHYDLGNDFYRLWLDPGMTYSSALFAGESDKLETAQQRKNDRVLDWLEVQPGHRILEIGCGWGGFAEAAIRRGCALTGLTLSSEQLTYARDRLSGVQGSATADLRLQDYRDVEGQFDRIASIEMIEAVGERYWPEYFRVLADRLAPGGIAVLQAITIPVEHFADYRRRPDFIQRYIFPGGMLPTAEAIESHGRAVGLRLDRQEQFSASYAVTLWQWLSRFRATWPEIAGLGFDERFRRMWEYYLIYCAVGFETGSVQVGHYRLVKAA